MQHLLRQSNTLQLLRRGGQDAATGFARRVQRTQDYHSNATKGFADGHSQDIETAQRSRGRERGSQVHL
jgi:hypothetical protein